MSTQAIKPFPVIAIVQHQCRVMNASQSINAELGVLSNGWGNLWFGHGDVINTKSRPKCSNSRRGTRENGLEAVQNSLKHSTQTAHTATSAAAGNVQSIQHDAARSKGESNGPRISQNDQGTRKLWLKTDSGSAAAD
jgi:hypothetical protein